MPYIDTKYLFKCETCRHFVYGHGCNTFCDSGECYSPNMNKIPTADVAPREDYEAVIAGQETLQKYLAKIKTEVAREIFEEIKEQLRGIFDFFRQDNDIRESYAIMFAISEVGKIEKKYTE